MGDHYNLDTDKEANSNQLTNNTFVTIADEDAGPTKSWIIRNRKDPKVASFFNRAYGKRPAEELYDLKTDPHQMNNLAGVEKYQKVKNKLSSKLMNILVSSKDPRVIDQGSYFEKPPLSGPVGSSKN